MRVGVSREPRGPSGGAGGGSAGRPTQALTTAIRKLRPSAAGEVGDLDQREEAYWLWAR